MDILDDVYMRLLSLGFNDPQIESVFDDMRKEWGGKRPYINGKLINEIKIKSRNELIIKSYADGEGVLSISKRFELSRNQVYKIIRSE